MTKEPAGKKMTKAKHMMEPCAMVIRCNFSKIGMKAGGIFSSPALAAIELPSDSWALAKAAASYLALLISGAERRSYRARQRQGEQRASCCPESESFWSVSNGEGVRREKAGCVSFLFNLKFEEVSPKEERVSLQGVTASCIRAIFSAYSPWRNAEGADSGEFPLMKCVGCVCAWLRMLLFSNRGIVSR